MFLQNTIIFVKKEFLIFYIFKKKNFFFPFFGGGEPNLTYLSAPHGQSILQTNLFLEQTDNNLGKHGERTGNV